MTDFVLLGDGIVPEIHGEGEEKLKGFCNLVSISKNFQKLLSSLSCLPCVYL